MAQFVANRCHTPVDAVLAAGGALTQAVDEDATADLGPVLRVSVHPETSRLRDYNR